MDNYISKLYKNNILTIKFDKNYKKFIIKNETGMGNIIGYDIYDGIYIAFNDMNLNYLRMSKTNNCDIISINYCNKGRMEISADKNTMVFISKDDFSISKSNNLNYTSLYPNGHYQGISIFIDIKKVLKNDVFDNLKLDFSKIENLIKNKNIQICNSSKKLEHIFYEFYNIKECFPKEHLRIKTFELLFFLTNLSQDFKIKKSNYLKKSHVKKIKKIQQFIVNNIEKHYTISFLSKKFSISTTSLKIYFKELYGDTIYNYTKKLKLEKSKNLLSDDNLSISQIAFEVGYENPAKFSSAFKKEFGISPSKFYNEIYRFKSQ